MSEGLRGLTVVGGGEHCWRAGLSLKTEYWAWIEVRIEAWSEAWIEAWIEAWVEVWSEAWIEVWSEAWIEAWIEAWMAEVIGDPCPSPAYSSQPTEAMASDSVPGPLGYCHHFP